MSSDSTALGDRMKGYEAAARYELPCRTYTICRVDGRAFHSYLRHAEKPFDSAFMDVMDSVSAALCTEMMGAVLAYAHSDEISVLLTDFGSVHTEAWFGGTVQKMASIAASTATAQFNYDVATLSLNVPHGRATFDARVFTIPDPVEVANYFVWRQRDCVRNSVAMAAQAHFSHKRLHGLNGGQMQELLWQEKGVNWNDYPDGAKRGRVCQRVTAPETVTYTDKRTQAEHTVEAIRSRWKSSAAPHFKAEADSFLADAIPAMPTLRPAGELVSLDQSVSAGQTARRRRFSLVAELPPDRCCTFPMSTWLLWFMLVALLLLPVLLRLYAGDEPRSDDEDPGTDEDGPSVLQAAA